MRWSLTALMLILLVPAGHAQEPLFHPDSAHPWNRLHRYLHVRSTPDGSSYDQEGLEPVFVRRSRFLTAGISHTEALARLDAFLAEDAETLIEDPLKRAIMQRDLWAVFVTTADPMVPRQRQRRALQRRLAQVMRRVALTEKEIRGLPANLQLSAGSGDFPAEFQPQHPERPFLPTDLLQPDGPWVLLRSRLRSDNLAAPSHVDATNGRAVFLLLLRLPAGRQATLDYLRQLAELPSGVEIPQIPVGTQVALLRRLMLIDDTGRLRLAPLTESLQIRVYQQLTAPRHYEFRLHRRQLLVGPAAGLQPTAVDERNLFDLGFLGFAPQLRHDPLDADAPRENSRRTPIVMKSCVTCHAGPGIFGFQSMFVNHFDRPPLGPTILQTQVSPVIARTHNTYAWGLLHGLWETGRRE